MILEFYSKVNFDSRPDLSLNVPPYLFQKCPSTCYMTGYRPGFSVVEHACERYNWGCDKRLKTLSQKLNEHINVVYYFKMTSTSPNSIYAVLQDLEKLYKVSLVFLYDGPVFRGL